MAVALAIFLATIVGLSARYSSAKMYAAYILEENVEANTESNNRALPLPSCRLAVNMRNSIAIRKALAKDAIYLIPMAGLLGLGLDNFMKLSCIKANEVHVSILQVAVEFGWLGCIFFCSFGGRCHLSACSIGKTKRRAQVYVMQSDFCRPIEHGSWPHQP